jgi:cholesterol transport system auxiliary component
MVRDPKVNLVPRFLPRSVQTRNLLARAAAIGLLAGGLVACSSNPIPTFDLSAPNHFSAGGGGAGIMVVVVPTALSALDTEKILVEPAPGQITYLSDAQWADRLPALLQARTIQAFENGSKLRRVARPSDGVTGDYQLTMDIRTFGVQVRPSGPQGVVELSAKVIAIATGRIVAAQVFVAEVPLSGTTGPAVASGLDQASNEVLLKIVRWASARF